MADSIDKRCGGNGPCRQSPRRHPLNADGPFYVEADVCVGCCLMHHAAPGLLGMHEYPPDSPLRFHCYVTRQPSTPEEVGRAIEAMRVSEVAALRYGGADPAILERARELGMASQCDRLSDGRETGQ